MGSLGKIWPRHLTPKSGTLRCVTGSQRKATSGSERRRLPSLSHTLYGQGKSKTFACQAPHHYRCTIQWRLDYQELPFTFAQTASAFLVTQKPRHARCLWCKNYGQENGRHFLECYLLPEALAGALKRLKKKCLAAGVPEGKLKDFLSLDWCPETPPTLLLKSVLVFQRSVLRIYRYRFYDGETNSPVGFPKI